LLSPNCSAAAEPVSIKGAMFAMPSSDPANAVTAGPYRFR
jgi:hypothetical protein